MQPRAKQIALWSAALLLGAACGHLAQSILSGSAKDDAGDNSSLNRVDTNDRSRNSSPLSSTSSYLWRETSALRNADTYEDEVGRLHRESKSPLRASSLHSLRIQDSTFEEWAILLGEGKVKRFEVLGELGAYLAKLDTAKALQLAFHGPQKFDNIDQVYAFRNPLVRTAADIDPELVLDALKGMKRGGAQMDNSRFFSEYWANKDPQAAADHFTDLVGLRNMRMEGSTELPDDELAKLIMRSWVKSDPNQAEAYVSSLPESPKRTALGAALDQIEPSQ
jgi:hypothetical protein